MTKCLKIDKREKWVDHLIKQNQVTMTKQCNEKWIKKIIATIITNPNETWNNLKREKYMVLKSYFQNN